jgi:acyl-coenzyme A thioesterase PaaI-like protein
VSHAAQFVVGALPYNAHLGLRAEPDGRIMVPDAFPLTNDFGTQHAGALFSAGHAASWAALVTEFADVVSDGAVPIATRSTIEHRGPARGPVWAGAHVCTAAAVREQLRITGRAECDVHVGIHDVERREVAVMTVTWRLVRREG